MGDSLSHLDDLLVIVGTQKRKKKTIHYRIVSVLCFTLYLRVISVQV